MHARFWHRLPFYVWMGWPIFALLILFSGDSAFAQSEPTNKTPRRVVPSISIQTSAIRCRITADANHFEVLDKRSKVTWESSPLHARLGTVTLRVNGHEETRDLENGTVTRDALTSVQALYHPLPGRPEAGLRVTFSAGQEFRTVDVSWNADASLEVVSIRLLDDALSVSDAEHGSAVIPIREGILVPADSGLAFTNSFDTYAYEGCHMAMAGLIKNGSAALISWQDPYTVFELKSMVPGPRATEKQALLSSLVLRHAGKSFQIQFLGLGDYNALGNAYREIARRSGWVTSWEEKIKQHPQDAKLIGAVDFKLWSALQRQMSADGAREESVKVNWTFDEAAQIAAHLKNDLKLDRVLFMVGGWIRMGYDNQHPDILPAAPECGGNVALSDCSRRVKALGYLFCLHDNYQDIYRNSPSWNESYVMKHADGSLVKGGTWAGGPAYLTCSQKALELARRPQNLEAVRQITGADAYFIDTTFASGLQECFDTNHPLTRLEDMQWKLALADYARSEFGVFGSECGREWAIPHSDFFEGFTGVSGRSFHDKQLPDKLGGTVIPLFEMVYRDSIAMFGKYGYDINQSAAYVLSQMIIGRTLNYHSIPEHLYWQHEGGGWKEDKPPTAGGDPAVFTRGAGGWTEGMHPLDRFVKNTYEVLSPLNELTAQLRVTGHAFLTADRKVQRTIFGAKRKKMTVVINLGSTDYRYESTLGGGVILPPYGFLIESPEFVATHALRWRELAYQSPVLFTLRSLDNQPLNQSAQIRIYHGFGDPRILLPHGETNVVREAMVSGVEMEKR